MTTPSSTSSSSIRRSNSNSNNSGGNGINNSGNNANVSSSSNGIAFGVGVAFEDVYHGNGVGGDEELLESIGTGVGVDDEDVDGYEAELQDQGRVVRRVGVGVGVGVDDGGMDDEMREANGSGLVNSKIVDRESEYSKRRFNRTIREDGLSFKDSMQSTMVEKEHAELTRQLLDGSAVADVAGAADATTTNTTTTTTTTTATQSKRRRRRWDDQTPATTTSTTATATVEATPVAISDSESSSTQTQPKSSRWDDDSQRRPSTKRRKRWDETPVASTSSSLSSLPVDATPAVSSNTWEETPLLPSSVTTNSSSSSSSSTKRSRWDSTPAPVTAVPSLFSSSANSASTAIALSVSASSQLEREMETRNRPWTDAALDAILPSDGYTLLPPPASYLPLRTPARKLLATPTPLPSAMANQGFDMEDPNAIRESYGVPIAATPSQQSHQLQHTDMEGGALPFIKPEDMQYFGKLLNTATDNDDSNSSNAGNDAVSSKGEIIEKKILTLLLKIKCGTPPQRKTAMRQITDKARAFGPQPLFHQLLPLLMSPTLEDQERHLLVKVIDRILYQLDDLVRPYVHRILAVIEPLLIDDDYYARVEGREIISNLAKAAGLPTMIATMRPDIDNPDEYVRNITSRAFAVVASALGVPALLPFLKAVCGSRKSWQARHTGIKIVQQIAVLMGCAVLPYLKELVELIPHGLSDEQPKVRTMTALTIAALAEAAYPYGIESFDSVIRPLWKGAREEHYGKQLAAFLKAIGYIIPLMEENYAALYTRNIMPILIREFQSPDEEMKRIVLKVVQQCVATAGVEPQYIRSDILPEFFRMFWIRRMALDRRNHKQVVDTTVELANKVGASDILARIVDDLKDDSEPYRRMVMETTQQILTNLGAADIDAQLEERLIDGILYAFQEQAVDASVTGSNAFGKEGQVLLDGFGTVVNALGERCKPYLKQIAGTIKWRLNNKAPSVRMQAADLISRIAVVMKACHEDHLMGHLGVVLYEYLGEEYPEVLGSILGALKAIVNVIGMTNMTPPIRDLLPRLTPILRNRHEKVQENCIDLVGRIADRGAEFVAAKEWMRICFELLEMLKAHKKAIRRASVSTFGFIAKAIGPQDVLHTLLNNLKVQDRQMRVCTTVAIAIVSETCAPFTVLPALMNEYRVPELNIQNGVLKALSFMFEYIGDMAKDYIYAVAPLLQDALMDRDQVHRQTACATVKHLALGVTMLGCEDVLLHLLNYVWPNIFEQSPHVLQAFFDAISGLMLALGPNLILQYTLQGLYHPARKVRQVYWRVYNTLYIFASDAIVMGYPSLNPDPPTTTTTTTTSQPPDYNPYARTTLELFI